MKTRPDDEALRLFVLAEQGLLWDKQGQSPFDPFGTFRDCLFLTHSMCTIFDISGRKNYMLFTF